MQTNTFRMDKQWGPIAQHGELGPISWGRMWWKIVWEKEYICICMCVCVYIYICMCVYIYMYVCVCVCIYMYIYGWATMLYSRNWHNTLYQLYSNFKKCFLYCKYPITSLNKDTLIKAVLLRYRWNPPNTLSDLLWI